MLGLCSLKLLLGKQDNPEEGVKGHKAFHRRLCPCLIGKG